jgi:hypothetical protein
VCGTVAFAKVVKPDPGDLHPSVFQFGPQGFGLARYPDEASDCASLIELADRRMYIDKVAKSAAPIPT